MCLEFNLVSQGLATLFYADQLQKSGVILEYLSSLGERAFGLCSDIVVTAGKPKTHLVIGFHKQ